MKKYHVQRNRNLSHLIIEINRMIQDGWVTCGGISHMQENYIEFSQAMVRPGTIRRFLNRLFT